ncbi:PAS domain-containing hybrid sensor histidine kinase/response regulator [Roseimicrobium sp. ORNL1]|uniref:hybrid sensor histidine kinase/response regulator n=1 Tax=Roseimicrobium sp. ORNL1 TaxID=2711231 RepID=UPI0013E13E5A|nr:PAS domain-containing hybrid sensor histidine kinase/response regulator [Roseimicrobium sp. ORNL1]QIF02825.1 response regulator [Roseimicrobium sp. ORNL1]
MNRSASESAAARKTAVQKKDGKGYWISQQELGALNDRLREAQETLEAIRNGEVDALVVHGDNGAQVYSLAGSDHPYRVYVEQMKEGAVTVSPEGLILFANRRFADMVGLPLEKVISENLQRFVAEEAWKEALGILSSEEESVRLETQLGVRKGTTLPVMLTASKLPLPEEQVICLVVTDLTEQREAESTRFAKEVAEQANLAKDSFLAALSHELRTPLTPALLGLKHLEESDEIAGAAKRELEIIRRNIELEARLIDDLLDLTRIARGKLELNMASSDLHGVLEQALAICQTEVESKNQVLDLELQAKHHQSSMDPVRMQQVLWNLIRNAIKFTPAKGSISIRTWNKSPKSICVEVSDNGIGFEPDMVRKMFEPFEQGGRHITRQFGGLGLGLMICRSIVEQHKGKLEAESPGSYKGAKFTLTLPLHAGHETKHGSGKAKDPSALFRTPLRVLLVEDHADTRRAMERILHKYDCDVVSAANAQEATKAAADHAFELVISDVGLPDCSGLELMAQLHKKFGLVGVAVSGYGMEDDIAASRDAGFIEHLTKPVTAEALKSMLTRVAKLLRK